MNELHREYLASVPSNNFFSLKNNVDGAMYSNDHPDRCNKLPRPSNGPCHGTERSALSELGDHWPRCVGSATRAAKPSAALATLVNACMWSVQIPPRNFSISIKDKVYCGPFYITLLYVRCQRTCEYNLQVVLFTLPGWFCVISSLLDNRTCFTTLSFPNSHSGNHQHPGGVSLSHHRFK